MKVDCEVIRDLLPLYADNACSEKSRELVSEHLEECQNCRSLLLKLRDTKLEDDLKAEKKSVIDYGAHRFKLRSALAGTTVSGVLLIPILASLFLNYFFGQGLGWFFVVLASLCVAASLIVVPIMVPEDKLFWTFISFCASLIILLAIICHVTHGKWFWIASSASLFGLATIFLPFMVKAKPVKELIGERNPWPMVVCIDVALFALMMCSIFFRRALGPLRFLTKPSLFIGVALVVLIVLYEKGE